VIRARDGRRPGHGFASEDKPRQKGKAWREPRHGRPPWVRQKKWGEPPKKFIRELRAKSDANGAVEGVHGSGRAETMRTRRCAGSSGLSMRSGACAARWRESVARQTRRRQRGQKCAGRGRGFGDESARRARPRGEMADARTSPAAGRGALPARAPSRARGVVYMVGWVADGC